MNYNQIIKKLYKLEYFGTKLGLANIRKLLEKLGNPQNSLKVIHVAGTNGKGSTCAMISQMLIEAGYKVGLYTSPHLYDFKERFLVNNEKISDEDVVKYCSMVLDKREDQTFFEVVTAMGFLYFRDQKVDFLVLETGLGGRLDATNVIKPLISVITNIGKDHTNYLGKSIKNIAYEKAGIIKNGVPTVTGADGTALEVIKNVCVERDSELVVVDEVDKGFELGLKGEFQYFNAGVAINSVDVLKKYYDLKVSKKDIIDGLKKAYIPGRFEFKEENLLVDCAHNMDGFRVLLNELKNINRKIILVIGILNDKDREGMFCLIEPLVDKIILTEAPVIPVRKTPLDELEKFVDDKTKIVKKVKDVKEAVKYAKSIAGKDDLVLVTGSLYIVGELK